jgi:PBP1b-binding outer membrane lipoprotein LpoB
MRKILFVALMACAFLATSCSSNVDKLLDVKKELRQAIENRDLDKIAELEKKAAGIIENMTSEERAEATRRILE